MNTQMGRYAPSGAPPVGPTTVRGLTLSPQLEVQWQQESVSFSPLPVVEGLSLGLRRVGGARWCGRTTPQIDWLNRMRSAVGTSSPSALPYAMNIRASVRAAELSTFARAHKLHAVGMRESEDAVGFVSRTDFQPRWRSRGLCTTIGNGFAAFRLSGDAQPQFYQRAQGSLPLIVIPTMNNDLALIDPSPIRRMWDPEAQLLERAVGLAQELKVARQHGWLWSGPQTDVVLPMVTHVTRWNRTELMRLFCDGRHERVYNLALAYEETNFVVSEEGASDSAKRVSRIRGRKTFTVDRPFFLTLIRPGISVPLFAGWYGQSSWLRWD